MATSAGAHLAGARGTVAVECAFINMLEMMHALQGIAGTPTDRTFEKWDVQNNHYVAYARDGTASVGCYCTSRRKPYCNSFCI